MKIKKRLAIIGGGPSGLFMFKRFVDSRRPDFTIDIFEKKRVLGSGMPYSSEGANEEHITNVSANEIPELLNPVKDWVRNVDPLKLQRFHMDKDQFNEYKVLPRLLFGEYLSDQFKLEKQKADELGMETTIHFESLVTDVIDDQVKQLVSVEFSGNKRMEFDHVIICTGHTWPKQYEGKISGYFDSPYPPEKLKSRINHPVAIKGSSLTAIDAIRTLARYNGCFNQEKDGSLSYQTAQDNEEFKLIMHSRNGFLPAIRIHLEDSHLFKDVVLSKGEINANRADNDGFLSLDYVFEKNFKGMIQDKDPEFYAGIKDMNIETFVAAMMELRERLPAFQLFRSEYAEAEKSIKRRESVYWKEMLGALSFSMNYPAKYFSAEDMLRLQKVLLPLISIVIAFAPQSSALEMLALHDAGVLEIVAVGDESTISIMDEGGVVYHYKDEAGTDIEAHFETFIDCVGQKHLKFNELPFKSLYEHKTVSPARIMFRDKQQAILEISKGNELVQADETGNYYLNVPGVKINDNFQAVDHYNALNERVYIMAVPSIGGYNPDYSGLDFCEAASATIFNSLNT